MAPASGPRLQPTLPRFIFCSCVKSSGLWMPRKIISSDILDLGCGTGIAGAAWALEMNPHPRITGIDRNSWAIREAKWTYGAFNLRAAVRSEDLSTFKIGKNTAVIAAFTINELSDEVRARMLRELLSVARQGSPVLVIEPIATERRIMVVRIGRRSGLRREDAKTSGDSPCSCPKRWR